MASVFLNELANDYLNPSSQGCINPLFTSESSGDGESKTGEETARKKNGATILHIEENGPDATMLLSTTNTSVNKKQTSKATVSVADCLACSGCVTSTDAVLVTSTYDLASLRNSMESSDATRLVCTVSEACVVDMARYFSTPMVDAYKKLEAYCRKELGSDMVVAGSTSGNISLIETHAEFVHRFQASRLSGPGTPQASLNIPIDSKDTGPPPSVAISAEETHYKSSQKPTRHKPGRDLATHVSLPMLVSTCPGWVCYVEKTAPYAIPFLSTVKSPMAISGALIKHVLCSQNGNSGNKVESLPKSIKQPRIFHLGIMPCHDKKLEASRKDLGWNQVMNGSASTVMVQDIDLVITTAELLQLFKESARNSQHYSLEKYWLSLSEAGNQDERQSMFSALSKDGLTLTSPTLSHEASSSGSYADFVFRQTAKELYGIELPATPLPWKSKSARNSDLKELTLYKHGASESESFSCENKADESIPVLNFARAYGFRNIQGILQRMKKRGRRTGFQYHFVEVMACPSGCLNGGGQIRHDTSPSTLPIKSDEGSEIFLMSTQEKQRESPAEVRGRMRQNHFILSQRQFICPYDSDVAQYLYSSSDIFKSPFDEKAHMLFHTRFHAVPKLELSSGAVEGVDPEDTYW